MDYEKAISWNMPKSFNLDEEKKKIRIKLAIIEMIQHCNEKLYNEQRFMERMRQISLMCDLSQSEKNQARYFRIKQYLIKRYNVM